MVFAAVVTPPPQLKVTPPVVEEAVKTWLVVVQVNTVGVVILRFGAAIFWVTVELALLVQPLAGSVTVTV